MYKRSAWPNIIHMTICFDKQYWYGRRIITISDAPMKGGTYVFNVYNLIKWSGDVFDGMIVACIIWRCFFEGFYDIVPQLKRPTPEDFNQLAERACTWAATQADLVVINLQSLYVKVKSKYTLLLIYSNLTPFRACHELKLTFVWRKILWID